MAFYKREHNEKQGVYYPLAVTVGKPVTTKEIAEKLARISTVSKSDVNAVLGDLASVMADEMKQGKAVMIDGLGSFRYTLDTEGVKDEAEFNFQKQVKAVRVRFTPQRTGGNLKGSTATRALAPGGIEWIELSATTATDGGTDGGDDGESPDPIV